MSALIPAVWLGNVPYGRALAWQRARREAVLASVAHAEALWLMEHPPVITTGRRDVGDLSHVRWPVVATERGGLATYHGPGQLVGALLVHVAKRGGGVRKTVCALERALVRWAQERGVAASQRPGLTGVWVGDAKLASIGLHFRRGASMHGFSLNLDVDPRAYAGFSPCGIPNAKITSLRREAGTTVAPSAAAASVGEAVVRAVVDTFQGHG